MARSRELVPGRCYFTLFYCGEELRIPDVETLIYRKSVPDGDGKTVWLFDRPVEAPADSDQGRTRILEFPGSGDVDRLAELCEAVFAQIYGMRESDSFAYDRSSGSMSDAPCVSS